MTTSFTFGGTALTTFGKVTYFNDAYDFPTSRNSDVLIPYKHGETFVSDYFAPRDLRFIIKYQGATLGALETINDTLKGLFSPRSLQTLAWTRDDTTVRNISAIVREPFQMDMKGNNISFFDIIFHCPSPFWRLSTAIPDNTTIINASPKAMTVTNPGTVAEYEPTLILTGPLQNTVITNSTNGYVLTYTGTIASPRVVTIQKSGAKWIATTDLGANVITNVSHSPGVDFMVFNKGSNTLSITDATATTGTVKATFNAPFI